MRTDKEIDFLEKHIPELAEGSIKKVYVRRVPDIRFPGFEGEWEEKKLKNGLWLLF